MISSRLNPLHNCLLSRNVIEDLHYAYQERTNSTINETMSQPPPVYIVSAVRTPIGQFQGFDGPGRSQSNHAERWRVRVLWIWDRVPSKVGTLASMNAVTISMP